MGFYLLCFDIKGQLFLAGFSILCLPFFFLRQKWGVFFFLDQEIIFKIGQVIFVP
jgi:hypothetical protein